MLGEWKECWYYSLFFPLPLIRVPYCRCDATSRGSTSKVKNVRYLITVYKFYIYYIYVYMTSRKRHILMCEVYLLNVCCSLGVCIVKRWECETTMLIMSMTICNNCGCNPAYEWNSPLRPDTGNRQTQRQGLFRSKTEKDDLYKKCFFSLCLSLFKSVYRLHDHAID